MRPWLRVPTAADDKYSMGVLGAVIGSHRYPGAAVLGTEAAWRTGVGMVRLGSAARVQDLVLARRPETIVSEVEDRGRANAYLIGSGLEITTDEQRERLIQLVETGAPIVLDAGALDLTLRVRGLCVITPHAGELVRMMSWLGRSIDRADVTAEHAVFVAENTGAVVVLKGATTTIAAPSGATRQVRAASHRAATAGSGDVLGGVIGGLMAQHAAELVTRDDALSLAECAVRVHAKACELLGNRPVVALEIAAAVADAVTAVRASQPE